VERSLTGHSFVIFYGGSGTDVVTMPGKNPAYLTKAHLVHKLGEFEFLEIDDFKNKVNFFPLKHQVIGRYLCLIREHPNQKSLVCSLVTVEIKDIWSKGNVPSKSKSGVLKQVDKLVSTFLYLSQYKSQPM
jgi:hypothetical protein